MLIEEGDRLGAVGLRRVAASPLQQTRAIAGLPVDEETRSVVRRVCRRRVWGHYWRTTVGWTLADLFRRR